MRINFLQNIIDFVRGKKHVETYFHEKNLEITPDDISRIEDYLAYKPTRKAKSVLYTCITNNYDDIEAIKTYKYVNPDWDYVCFTDNQEHINQGKIGIWEIRPLVYTESDNTRNNRWHKLNPHVIFPEYEESIYIDPNINILTDKVFKTIEEKNLPFVQPRHFKNTCIYQEYKDVLHRKLDDVKLIKDELALIKKDKMPKNYGFGENNLLYRRHNLPQIVKIDTEWWNMVLNYAKRDQISLAYLLWKNGIEIKDITFKNTRLDPDNFYVFAHKRGVNVSSSTEQATSLAQRGVNVSTSSEQATSLAQGGK